MSTHALEAGLRSGLGVLDIAATEAQITSLLGFADLLLRWNATHNLTAIRQPAEALTHHLLDCLAVLPHIQTSATNLTVLDVGSGGGLPGVVWAIMRPQWCLTCVDAVGKKMAFVRQAAGSLSLANLEAVHTRLGERGPANGLQPQGYDLVTSRAFASLADFVNLTRFHVKQSAPSDLPGQWLALKGRHPQAEIEALPTHAQLQKLQDIAVPGLNEARCLVWLRPVV